MAITNAPTLMATAPDEADEPTRRLDVIEEGVERVLFASRWLLAPLYIGLIAGLFAILVKFAQALWELLSKLFVHNYNEVTLGVLELLDITLLANLVLIVVFAGYETFVSKIGIATDSEDRPHWMGHVDYSGLKMKLIGSIVAISVIGLLQDFLNASDGEYHAVRIHVLLHVTFLASGVLFAVMDYIAERRLGIRTDNQD